MWNESTAGKKTKLTPSEVKELASNLRFQKFKAMEEIITFGEVGHEYFLLIKGVVSVLIPNPEIQDWNWKQ